jgi:hypothetical protein
VLVFAQLLLLVLVLRLCYSSPAASLCLTQVPTVAIEKVFFKDNTSVMQEEVMAHRFGLVPLAVDPEMMDMRGDSDAHTTRDTLVFRLDVTANDVGVTNVLSGSLVWQPHGDQVRDSQRLCASPSLLRVRVCACACSCAKMPVVSAHPVREHRSLRGAHLPVSVPEPVAG